jgi:hypothetical protein
VSSETITYCATYLGTIPQQCAIKGLGTKTLELSKICVEGLHEPGGAPPVANTAAVPARGTASLGIIGMTEKVTTANAEALEPRTRVRLGVGSTQRCLPTRYIWPHEIQLSEAAQETATATYLCQYLQHQLPSRTAIWTTISDLHRAGT